MVISPCKNDNSAEKAKNYYLNNSNHKIFTDFREDNIIKNNRLCRPYLFGTHQYREFGTDINQQLRLHKPTYIRDTSIQDVRNLIAICLSLNEQKSLI